MLAPSFRLFGPMAPVAPLNPPVGAVPPQLSNGIPSFFAIVFFFFVVEKAKG